MGEEGCRVAVAHVVRVAARGEVDADAARAEDGDGGVGGLHQQAGAVLDGAAVAVGAAVGAVLQELVEQVAVGGVQLDTVEAGALGIGGGLAELLDDGGDLLRFQGAGRDIGTLRAEQADMALRGDGTGSDGRLAAEEGRIGDAADMPDLGEDTAAGLVHGAGDGLPALDLLLAPEAGDIGIADRQGGDGHALADDQAGGGALAVVFGHQGARHMAGRAGAGEGRHDDAVGQGEVAQADRVEEIRHRPVPMLARGVIAADVWELGCLLRRKRRRDGWVPCAARILARGSGHGVRREGGGRAVAPGLRAGARATSMRLCSISGSLNFLPCISCMDTLR